MGRLKLIDKPECPFCWRVRIALALQGRPVDSLDRSDPEVLVLWQGLSPNRTVPVLIDDDLVLTDSGPMLEYLAETGPTLLPDTPRQRAEARSWMIYGDNVLGSSIREVVFEKRDKTEKEWDQNRIREGVRGFMKGLSALEAGLAEQLFLVGNQPTLAECVLFPRFALALAYNVGIPDDFPLTRQWFERMTANRAFVVASPERIKKFLIE